MRFLHVAMMAGLAALGCSSSKSGATGTKDGGPTACVVDTSYDPPMDPTKFVPDVTNPLFPLVAGTKRTYRAGVTGTEKVEITVNATKKTILGIQCTEIHDVHSVAGDPIEDTLDWFAQDTDGTVWYMGEDTKELKAGMITSREGSWTAGVDGAKPGKGLPGSPKVGDKYRQEYYACHAEDMGEILALDASATTGDGGSYTGCLQTHDYTALETSLNEQKYYCPKVGNVLSVDMVTGEREELVSIEPAP